ncbi:hypothetical protein SynBIOSE41_01654 [Synechococcus sp. BIOS-E4-1]|nr:hypothetical protein SynBIOSE41_01654 [Synechococcus sp. BIOS-E4-1]
MSLSFLSLALVMVMVMVMVINRIQQSAPSGYGSRIDSVDSHARSRDQPRGMSRVQRSPRAMSRLASVLLPRPAAELVSVNANRCCALSLVGANGSDATQHE